MTLCQNQELTPSTEFAENSIHLSTAYATCRIIPRSTLSCSQPVSFLNRPCCTQFSTFTQLRVKQWMHSQLSSRLPPELPPPDWPPSSTPPISLDHGLKVISKLARLQPPSVSLNTLDYSLQVCTITAFKCISKLNRLWPPGASWNSLNHGLQVPLQTRLITASKCISKLARLQPPSVSPNSLDYSLGVYL